MKKDEGSISILSLAILTLALALLAGIISGVYISNKIVDHTISRNKIDIELNIIVQTKISSLLSQYSPEADSEFDSFLKDDSSEVAVRIISLSDKWNPQFFDSKYLELSPLNLSLKTSVSGLNNKIVKDGFSESLNEFENYLDLDSDLFTVYSWFPECIGNENSRTLLYNLNKTADSMKNYSDPNKSSSRIFIKDKPFNINLVDERILEAMIYFKWESVKERFDPGTYYSKILTARESHEITESEIPHLLKDYPFEKHVIPLFGTKTWFWEITAIEGKKGIKCIIALDSEYSEDSSHIKYALIRREYFDAD